MADSEITISASAFKAKCLDLFKRLERGKLKRITVTRRGKPVAVVAQSPPAKKPSFDDIYGCMRGTIEFAPDYDPFEQLIGEPSDPFLDKKPSGGSSA
jgi:prevent-host-death family protein